MGELSGAAAGQISQFFGANPIVTFASGITAALATLAILVRLWKSTGPSDAYVKALAERVTLLEARNDEAQKDRNDLAYKLGEAEKLLATATANVAALQQRLASVEIENQRLRDQNANQELRLAECDREARAAQGKIAALERQVRDLEAANRRAHPQMLGDGTSAPPGSQATGTVLGTLIEAKAVKPEGEV